MKAALFALLFVAAVFAEVQSEEGVLVLTDSTFHETRKETDYLLAEFYAPWCGHCKKLAPEYAAAAQALAKSNPEIKLAKIDCTVEKELAKEYDIKGFPTLKFFIKGIDTPLAYEGGRTRDEIIHWLKKKTGPPSVELKSADNVEETIGNNEVVAIFFGASGSEAYNAFHNTAAGFEDLTFAHTFDEAARTKYSPAGESVVLFKKFDEGKNVFTGPFDASSIRQFIEGNRHPSVIPFDQKAAQRIFGSGLDTIFLIIGDDQAGANAEKALREVVNDIKGDITVSLAKINEGLGERLAGFIGVNKDKLPAIRIVKPKNNNQKFLFENEITAENIKQFVANFKTGGLTPYFKSQEIPAQSHEDNVRVVVGKNFREVVLDENTDVLMEYYAPWCGHCKSLAPTYAAVATKLKDVQGLVIGKMDATENEFEGLSIQSFPTLKFYPRGSKGSPLDYSGERTEEGFIEYLKKNSKAQFPTVDPSHGDL